MNKCVDSSPVASSAIANEVQSELAHLLSEDSLGNVEVGKRRAEERSSGESEFVQADGSPNEVVKKQDNLFSVTKAKVPVPSSLKPSKEKASEIPFHNSAAASAQIIEYKRLQLAHSRLRSESEDKRRASPSLVPVPSSLKPSKVDPSVGSVSSLNDRSTSSRAPSVSVAVRNDQLFSFLKSQQQCIKGSVEDFYNWLVKSEDIDSIAALKEAVIDEEYLNETIKVGSGESGVKGFKRKVFQRAVLDYQEPPTSSSGGGSCGTTQLGSSSYGRLC